MDTFQNKNGSDKKMTISDIAAALEVSTTTVSRAISGNGRVSTSTRERVLEYIKRMDYKPNFLAQALAKSKTFHIGMLLPENCELADMSFFINCMQGVCEQAAIQNYDIVMISGVEDDISNLQRMVDNAKVDGIILNRSQERDTTAAYLLTKKMPFVLIGSSEDERIVQIDLEQNRKTNKESPIEREQQEKPSQWTAERLARELGMLACRILLSYIDGEEVQRINLLRI